MSFDLLRVSESIEFQELNFTGRRAWDHTIGYIPGR